jgi:hypothetical protein
MSPVSRLASTHGPVAPDVEFARCFLRLCNLRNYAIDRLSRYEATLWRQAGLFALDSLDRCKPQERMRRSSWRAFALEPANNQCPSFSVERLRGRSRLCCASDDVCWEA